MTRKASLGLGLAGCLLLAGCFDVEQTLVLQKDLSGKAGFTMKVDMEPMVLMMVMMQRSMAGQEGEPTAAEIEKAKKEFLASKKTEGAPDPAQQKEELAKGLPAGVRLLDSRFEDEGLKLLASFALGFDDVDKLRQVSLSPPKAEGGEGAEAGGPPAEKNPFDTPFGDLTVEEQGEFLLVTTPARNPLEEQKQEMGGEEGVSPEMEKQLEQAFKGLRVAWKIEAPFPVVEHNAHRQEGKTLIWEYTLDSMKTMDPKKMAEGIRVKYRKI
jgi:hypothetical protein